MKTTHTVYVMEYSYNFELEIRSAGILIPDPVIIEPIRFYYKRNNTNERKQCRKAPRKTRQQTKGDLHSVKTIEK